MMAIARDKDEGGAWHLDPKVTLAVLGWLFSATAAGVGWAITVSRDLAVLQSRTEAISDDNNRQDDATAEAMRLIRDELREMRGDMRAMRELLQRAPAR